jgi:hypothetical protein
MKILWQQLNFSWGKSKFSDKDLTGEEASSE